MPESERPDRPEPGAAAPRDPATVPEAAGEPEVPVTLGHFALGRRLGGGGMGVVFEARDTVLDRTVALKLLRPDSRSARRNADKARTRLLREAQALARLKHPNVVTVFEVGAAGDEIFIAMELVEGDTLREWMRTPHDWREVVDVFAAVGRGLAAAHALGLIHRDVKPSNVFLDRDGTPKVGDFGLVSTTGAGDDPSGDDRDSSGNDRSPLDPLLTSTGSVMGTPAYMAPEQIRGERVDARADQYAFCASLFEALSGRLPGGGERAAADAAAVRQAPPRLRAIVARGLAAEPAERYPSMSALLADLVQARRGRARLWLAAGGGAAVVVIAAGAWTLARSRISDDPCPAPSAQLDPVWGAARRAAVREHVLAIDHTQGAARMAAATAHVDPYVHAWSEMVVGACRATRVQGGQSDTLLDLRMRCLDRRLAELDDGIGLVAAARPLTLDRALGALVQTSPLDECADAAALTAAAPPPADRAARASAEALARQLVTIATRRRGGLLDGLPGSVASVVDQARELGHAPTLAATLAEQAQVELVVDDSEAAATTLRELTQVAARAHDDRDEAFAWTSLVNITGSAQGKATEALALVPAASAAVLRAGEPVDLRAKLLLTEGQVDDVGPHPADGLAKLEQARALLAGAGAEQAGSALAPLFADVLFAVAGGKLASGDTDGAIAGNHQAIAQYQRLFGPDSPDEAYGWHNLGAALRAAQRFAEAEAALRTAIRIRETRLGPSMNLASSVAALATVLADDQHWDEALATYDRGLAIARSVVPADDPQLVGAMLGRARALKHLGRPDDAARGYADVIASLERSGQRTSNLPMAVFDRAELYFGQNRCDLAVPDYLRSIPLFEEVRGKDAGILVYPLLGLGRCLLAQGHAADAIAPLERALTVHGRDSSAALAAVARFQLDRARVESGRDRARSLADVRAARAALVAAGGDPGDLRELDDWTRTHGH